MCFHRKFFNEFSTNFIFQWHEHAEMDENKCPFYAFDSFLEPFHQNILLKLVAAWLISFNGLNC